MTRQRLCLVVSALALLGCAGWVVTDAVWGQQVIVGQRVMVGGAVAQPAPGGMPVPDKKGNGGTSAAAQLSGIKILEKSEFRQVINVARDCIKDKAWEEAVTALQALLDNKEDHYVQVRNKDAAGKEMLRWTSVKFEANNLLGSMPGDGLAVYELRFGTKAKDRLDKAKQRGDRELLADVAQRYCHTKAGIEANELLATLFLARGQFFMAALRFEKLLSMDAERTNLSDLTLYKAALAFQRAGDEKNAATAWKKLEANLQGAPLRVGDDLVPIAKLKQVLAEDAGALQVNPYEWPLLRGDQRNTAQANGSPPLLDTVLWRRPLMQDRYQNKGTEIGDLEKSAIARIDQAINAMKAQGQPILSGFFPIATKGMLIFRTHTGIRTVAIKEVSQAGRKHLPGSVVWASSTGFSGGLSTLLNNSTTQATVNSWLDGPGGVQPPQANVFPGGIVQPGFGGLSYFKSGLGSILYENTTLGTLSTDHQFVYAIDDLAVPPPMSYMPNPYMVQPGNLGELRKHVGQNTLLAFSIDRGGKLEWELGGPEDPNFADSHFLGVPLSIGGKLYILNEKNPPSNQFGGDSELRLVCIDPTKKTVPNRPTVVEPIQTLGMVQAQYRVANDVSRRTNAVHLAFGEGILVCPTNAGEVFGVDLMSRSLVWSYPYREHAQVSPFQMNMPGVMVFGPGGRPGMVNTAPGSSTLANWKSAPPAIADGKVVFTAPDANSVHCINLRDGTPVWKSAQVDGDLYLAGVYNGKVLIVGKSSIRALNLQTGVQLWTIATGAMPSGQGVASNNVYYLPLSHGEILAVDLERGSIKAHNRAAGDSAKTPPGNLVFYEGAVLSLTPTDVVAYPQLTARLDAATVALRADPDNLEKLTNHGELLLKDGQVQAAVADLEKVLERKPDGPLGQRAKDRMYEALTDLLQVSFNDQSNKYLAIYKELTSATTDEKEQQRRLARYYRTVGQGREAQGNLVEAFQMYKDFGALPIHNETGGVASLDDPTHKVPVNVWLRGRISTMIANAEAAQKAPLEAKIAEEWQQVVGKKDLDAIRRFVGMFDVPFAVGRQARLHLAEAIIERNDRASFLEAELDLDQLRRPSLVQSDPASAGRALAALAQLEEKKGTAESLKLAANYYRELGQAYAKVEVRQGKTGADLFNDLAADKRFLPYLEVPRSGWGNVKLGARKAGGVQGPMSFQLVPVGDPTPFAQQYRLTIDNTGTSAQVRLVEAATGKERWSQSVNHPAGSNQFFAALYNSQNFGVPYNAQSRHRFFHLKGHLIVAQVGAMACCFDGDNGKVLWTQPLIADLPNQGAITINVSGADAEGNPEFVIWQQQLGRQSRLSLGYVAAVQSSYVALVTPKGLVVLDPLHGTVAWKKSDVDTTSRVFGDEEYLFVVRGSDGDSLRSGSVLRAIDGAVEAKVPDFGPIYQHRINVRGRHILAATPAKGQRTLRLYDIIAGKDIWSKNFAESATVLRTEDPTLTGVIDAKGNVTVLDAGSGAELLTGNVVHRKVGIEDCHDLDNPLLLADADRVYIALNKAVEPGKSQVHNNFANNLRCAPVNGWVVALHRKDGVATVDGVAKPFKKGDFAWHTFTPITHQMLVLEQVDQLPVLLFSARYTEMLNAGMGMRSQAVTQSVNKSNGKFVFDEAPEGTNNMPQFSALTVDARAGTFNLVGPARLVQHYIDDGRKLPELNMTTSAGESGMPGPYGGPAMMPGQMFPQPPLVIGGPAPIIRVAPPAAVAVPAVPLLPPPAPPQKK